MLNLLGLYYKYLIFSMNYSNSLNKLTISIIDNAASKPLFPDLVPALDIACSIVSVVNTPNITGTSESKPTFAVPLS